MLFNKKGNSISGIKDLFTNQNAQILKEDSSKLFLSRIAANEDLWNQQTVDSIRQFGKGVDGVNKSLVDYAVHAKEAKLSSEQIGQGFAAQTSFAGKFQQGISRLGAKVKDVFGMLGDALVSTIISGAISLAIQEVMNVINSYENLAKKVNEIGTEFTKNKKTVEDYTGEIKELRGVLADQNSSTEEVTNATSRLYEIQNDLVGTYGSYANGIDLVNGKLNQQLEIIDNINKQNAQKAINEINNERSGAAGGLNLLAKGALVTNPIGNALLHGNTAQKIVSGYRNEKGFLETLDEIVHGDIFGYDLGETVLGSSVDQITDKFEKFNATVEDVDSNKILQLAEGLDSVKVNGNNLEFDGSVEEVTEDITILQGRVNELNSNGQFDGFLKQLQSVNKDATETLNSSQEAYDTILMSDIYDDAQLFDYYKKVQQAYEDVQKAREDGTYEDVQAAQQSYKALITGLEESGLDKKYMDYFEGMYPELQNLVSEWELEAKIIPTIDEDKATSEYLKNNNIQEIIAEYNKYFGEDRQLTSDIENQVRSQLSKDDLEKLDYVKKNMSPEAYTEAIWKYVDELQIVSDDLRGLIQAYSDSSFSSFNDFIGAVKGQTQYSDDWLNVKTLLGDNWSDDMQSEFSEEELEIAATIEPRYTKESQEKYNELVEKLPENFPGDLLDLSKQVLKIDPYKIDELKKLIEERLNPLELDIEPELNSADAVNNLDKFRDTIGGLDTVYETTVTNKGIASASDLQGVNDSFGGVTFNQDVENTNALSNALEAYNDTLIKTPGNAEKAKEATNRLVTAYIDQSDTLQDLDKSTKQYHIDQLKSQGIENAEEVVVSRLSDTYKKFSKNLQTLSKSVAQYHDALQADESSDEFQQGANAIAKDLTKLFTTVGANGEDITPNIDSSFVVANLDDIRAAAENDTDAIARLRVEAAKTIDLGVNVHDEQIYSAWNQISNMIANLDGTRFQIGGAMDDSAIIAALNNILSTGRYTVSEFQRMVSQISGGTLSAQVGWETKTVQFAAPTFSFADWKSQGGGKITSMNVGNYMKKSATFSMPKFSYKYNGSPTGAGARYSGGGGGGRSSGGGGGGGGGNSGGGGGSSSASEPNKPQEEAEDSFDWIEVAIQRIEEEIERLDKVVNNSYTTWAKRNSALAKELQKTKDEIKAQAIAQQEYTHYLGTIKVNNGKGLNADDYGENDQLVKQQDQRLLDEARRLWATGQYQRKIQNGQMTGNDIEKIQNHFLVDTINEYKEFYQKSVEARDAVEDLKIKLGELARVNFDNLQSEFEEAQAYFEATADLIDERIDRTEQKGYFVSTNYYNELAANEKKNLASLQNEYNKLIAKRNEAISNAYIEKGSSEWNQMNQEILDVAKSIESATTNLVDFQNQIRQIKWDVFDYTRERIEKVNDEFEFLIDLLDNQKLYDDYGAFNDRGWADAALHAQKYNVYMQQSLDYAKERTQVEKELAKDKANKTLIERREELIKLQQESIQNSYAEKEAIRDLVEEGINIHLSKLSELIDEYKRAMNDARDLYTYQKNIAEQTKNISNIQKQLQAYQGDDSEEMRATIQKLRTNLEQAQTQLRETQWDKYISETETFLQDMYDDYEETLMARLDNVDLLVTDLIDNINANSGDIKTIIRQVTDEVAYHLTDSANTAINTGTIVSDFKYNFDTYSTTVQNALNDIKSLIASISNKTVAEAVNTNNIQSAPAAKSTPVSTPKVNYASSSSMAVTSNTSTSKTTSTPASTTSKNYHTMSSFDMGQFNAVRGGRDYSPIFDVNYYMNRYADLKKAFGTDYNAYLTHFIDYGMKEGRQASDTFDINYYKSRYGDLQKAYGNNLKQYYLHFLDYGINEGRVASAKFNVLVYKKYGDLQKAYGSNLRNYYSHYNKWGAREGRKSYATGTRSANNEQAWTNEGALYGKGGEIIYRRSDGAILTPLHNGDKVFTAEMSDNLWNLAKLGAKPNVPLTNVSRTVNNNNAINITLPNVTNYEQFKTQLKNDPNMTNFIQEITLGEVTTGVKLNKRKL